MSPSKFVAPELHERMCIVSAQGQEEDGDVWQPQKLLIILLWQLLPPLKDSLEWDGARPLLHSLKPLQQMSEGQLNCTCTHL